MMMVPLAQTAFQEKKKKAQGTLFESNIRPPQGDSTQTTIYRILQQNISLTKKYNGQSPNQNEIIKLQMIEKINCSLSIEVVHADNCDVVNNIEKMKAVT